MLFTLQKYRFLIKVASSKISHTQKRTMYSILKSKIHMLHCNLNSSFIKSGSPRNSHILIKHCLHEYWKQSSIPI
jgi:hypothetical protein